MNSTFTFKRVLWWMPAIAILVAALAIGLPSMLASGADHLDAPLVKLDGRTDINDVYVFQSPSNPDNTVLIMTVNPAAGVLSPTEFRSDTSYDFFIDTDGDAKEEIAIRTKFGKPNSSGQQSIKVHMKGSKPITGMTGTPFSGKSGIFGIVDTFDDPFFFDLDAFTGAGGRSFCDGGETDFFAGLNVSAIVLEVPSDLLESQNIGVWGRTNVDGFGQIDRMGRPAINTVFIPTNPFEPGDSMKDAFNFTKPKKDSKVWRDEITNTLELFYPAGDPAIDAIADILLPDILTFDTASSAGFLNGRKLADDVIDAELALVTNSAVVSDCVGSNDVPMPTSFPYLAPAQ